MCYILSVYISFFRIILCLIHLCMCDFVVLNLVSSVGLLCQEISCGERLRGDIFCVEWDIKRAYVMSSLVYICHAPFGNSGN